MIALLCLFFRVRSQDVNFISDLFVPQVINYGFVGAFESTNVGVVSKTQWPASSLRSQTQFGFFDTYFDRRNIGLGVQLLNQKQQETGYGFTHINTAYTYPIRISDQWYFRPAIAMGWGMITRSQRLTFADQININTGLINPTSIDPLASQQVKNDNFFDFGTSLLFNNDWLWAGITLKHLNQPNISNIQESNLALPIHASVHASVHVDLPKYFYRLNPRLENSIYFMVKYNQQASNNRLDVNTQYVYRDFGLGLGVAMTPFSNNQQEEKLNYLMMNTSYKWNRFKFGFSYAYELRKAIASQGIFELYLLYDFGAPKRRTDACPKVF